MSDHFDTSAFAPSRRMAAWRDIVCDVYTQLDCRSDCGSAFYGSIRTTRLGVLDCTQIVSTAQNVRRTRERVARARQQHVLIAFAHGGRGVVRQDGRELLLAPGEFTLYDTARPYELAFDGAFRQTILKLPREYVLQRTGGTERLTAMGFSAGNPLERLAMNFVRHTVKLSGQLPVEIGSALSNQMLDLLALVWTNRLALDRRGSSSHRQAVLLRLKALIDEHLGDPELSIADVARLMGISVRSINSLLEIDNTSFRRHVLMRRLEKCRRQLAEPAQAHLQISEIAFAWGFNDLAHFSRSFRKQYDCSPREWRQENEKPQ